MKQIKTTPAIQTALNWIAEIQSFDGALLSEPPRHDLADLADDYAQLHQAAANCRKRHSRPTAGRPREGAEVMSGTERSKRSRARKKAGENSLE